MARKLSLAVQAFGNASKPDISFQIVVFKVVRNDCTSKERIPFVSRRPWKEGTESLEGKCRNKHQETFGPEDSRCPALNNGTQLLEVRPALGHRAT